LNYFQINQFKIFQRFRISTEFLNKDPALWESIPEYVEGKKILVSLKVVNDCAERGVKLIEEFNDKFIKQEEQKKICFTSNFIDFCL
jgi:hypothetical protein